MKHLRISLLIAALAAMLATVALADDAGKKEEVESQPKELKNQTHCPVMGGVIDSTVFTDIQGQRVYHCCPMCSAKLKADPDKYFKKAAAEGVLFENIQTTCPVSGEKLEDKSVLFDYEGRRVYFCCEMCQPKFEKDPRKYLSILDNMSSAKPEEGKKMDESDDQSETHHHDEEGH